MLAHQRTDQQYKEQHRTSQKHSPPPEESEAGAHIDDYRHTEFMAVYHSLVTEASTKDGRQAGRTNIYCTLEKML
ncbi:hypothetical protein LEMLEM_LOCUS7545, partial [Lemmus lemmus]